MVEVFITNVDCTEKAETVIQDFKKVFPRYAVNFDLEDSDKILRVESEDIDTGQIIETLNRKNIDCKILE